jgi:hypothetical protein
VLPSILLSLKFPDSSGNLILCLYLQVYSREVWRSSINSGSYDRQCDKLVWGLENHVKKEEKNVSS